MLAIVTRVSDSRTLADDKSGDTLVRLIEDDGHKVSDRRIVRDEQAAIIETLKEWIEEKSIDVIISTGGTGVTGRDVTPEAFEAVFEKKIDGFGELFRQIVKDKAPSLNITGVHFPDEIQDIVRKLLQKQRKRDS